MSSNLRETKKVDFSDEEINMAMDLKIGLRGSYTNDIIHNNAIYSDENLLLVKSSDVIDSKNLGLKDLKNKVIEKMSKRYCAKI